MLELGSACFGCVVAQICDAVYSFRVARGRGCCSFSELVNEPPCEASHGTPRTGGCSS